MAKILFKSFDEIKTYVGTAHRMDIATVQGYAFQATQRYLIPVLGRDFYNSLLNAYQSSTLTTDQQNLLEYVQRPLAFYTMVEAAPTLMVQAGDAGILEAGGGNISLTRQWVVRDAVDSWLQSGDLFTDQLLEYLENSASLFSTWQTSDTYTLLASSIIQSADQLSEFINVQGSRRTFLALRPFILRAQELHLPEVMGQALYDELVAYLASLTPDANYANLIKVCVPFIAHTAIWEAIPEITLQISGNGIKVLQSADGITSKLQASDQAIATLQSRHSRLSDTYRVSLINFLEANAANYPSYVPAGVGLDATLLTLPDNTDLTAKSFLL